MATIHHKEERAADVVEASHVERGSPSSLSKSRVRCLLTRLSVKTAIKGLPHVTEHLSLKFPIFQSETLVQAQVVYKGVSLKLRIMLNVSKDLPGI